MSGGFCTLCGHRIDNFDGLRRCPNCHCNNPPCSDADQVTISINVRELRILGIWSENWALRGAEKSTHPADKAMPDIVYAILNRIQKQLPLAHQQTPLSFREELGQLRSHGYDFQTNHPAADTPELGEHYKPDGDPDALPG